MPKITQQKPAARSSAASDNGKSRSAWDLATRIKMLLYGQSRTGKTTLWATFPKPIRALICSGGMQPGELRSIDTPEYRRTIDPIIVESSAHFRQLVQDSSLAGHNGIGTFVLDHASGLQDMVLMEILGRDEIPTQKTWGLATQQQYGQLALQVKELFRLLLNLPCHVVIVAQERQFGGDGDSGSTSELIAPTVGAALTPSITGWLNPACDYVVQTFLRPKMIEQITTIAGKPQKSLVRGKGVEFCLRTEPHDVFMTKFRVPLGRTLPDVIVDPTFEKIQKVINGVNL